MIINLIFNFNKTYKKKNLTSISSEINIVIMITLSISPFKMEIFTILLNQSKIFITVSDIKQNKSDCNKYTINAKIIFYLLYICICINITLIVHIHQIFIMELLMLL